MSWIDAPLNEEQRDVASVVETLLERTRHRPADERAQDVAAVREELADAGLWSLGIDEELGGGGADLALRLSGLAALGAHLPSLAWASAQAHAAVELISEAGVVPDLVTVLSSAAEQVCLVEADSWAVDVAVEDGRIRGRVARIDPAAPASHLLVISRRDGMSYLVAPGEGMSTRPLARAGMAGAMSVSLTVDAPVVTVPTPNAADVMARLHLAGGAIAAGLACEAATRATRYANDRHQFGAPLTALPTVRQSLFSALAQARQSLEVALSPASESPRAAAGVLVRACETAIDVAATAVQSHGGYGYLAEYEVERIVRDAVSLRAATDAQNAGRLLALTLAGAAAPTT